MTKVSPWGSLNEDYPNFIAVSRYARWIEDEGRRETWAETVNRYATFMSNKLGDKIDDKTVVELHNAILDQEIMPSMRALMTAGEALERENIAGYNPVSGDTVILTSDGMKEIRSLSGKSATVLNKDGRWADAEFRGYGDQDVFNVVLRRKKSGTTQTVVATGNHRWVKTNGDVVSTAELVSGDKIPYSVAPRPDTDNIDYQLGVIHGLVYGDGTSTYSQERLKGYHIRLCGSSRELVGVFADHGKICYPPSANGDPVVMLYGGFAKTHSLKELPVGETPEYNLGFLRGWMAADGSVAKSNSQVTLCVNSDGLEWFDTYAPTVGILRTGMQRLPDKTNFGERKRTAYSLRLDRASMIADDFIIGCKRDRFIPLDYEVDYAVVSVSPAGKSDVYCAEVPDTNTFVLSNGIVTGNCAFVAVDNVRAFDEALYVLMNGTGLGFNVESAYVSKLPSMPPEFFDTETTIVVHDSKLGWAKAYKELIALLLQGQVPTWDLSRVRPAGAKLKTFGGRACLTGDTIVYKDRKKARGHNEITIADLYDLQNGEGKWKNKPNHFKQVKLRALSEKDGIFYRNNVLEVIDNGFAPVYEIVTENGYRIKATGNHRFMTSTGDYDFVDNFNVGDLIAVNGSKEKKTGVCIDCNTSVSRRSIRCRPCANQNQIGDTALLTTARQRKECRDYLGSACERCGVSETRLTVHHQDKNPYNNDWSNLETLCEPCHQVHHANERSFGDPYSHKYLSFDEIISIEYAGVERVFDLAMEAPDHNFVANGFVSHNSGPDPLDKLFVFTVESFKRASGRKLKPIEVHDIMCKIAEVVVIGGVRRCLVSASTLYTLNGITTMGDVQVGDTIVSGGRKAKVIEKVDSGKQQTVIVKHQYGQSEMTPNHRIAVFDGIDSYTFKEAGALVPGDRLVWDLAGYDGEIQSLPRPSYQGHFNAKPFVIPDLLDADIAWLIGLVHGDGHIHAKGIEIAGHEGEWATLERANAIFADKFGVAGNVSRDSHEGRGIRLRVNSTGLALWFAENIKNPNVSIRVPSFVMNSQRDTRAAYLAGVLDSDGRVRHDNILEQATSIYPEFVEDLRLINLSLGIATATHSLSAQRRRDNGENAKDYQTLRIKGKTSRRKYLELVQPYSEKLAGIELSDKNAPHDFTYPAEWGLLRKSRNTQRTALIEKGLLDADYPFAPVEVLSVELGSTQQTWDIEVEDIHEFTADGLVTHNSALISMSDLDDFDMSQAKSGKWWEHNGQRALSNNSAVYYDKPSVGQFFTEWSNLYESKSGERGIINMGGIRKHVASFERRDASKIVGKNPCVTADTWVATSIGARQVKDLIGAEFDIIVDSKPYSVLSDGFVYTGNKEVYLVTSTDGYSFKATADHKILTERGWVEVQDLNDDDRMILSNNKDVHVGEYDPAGYAIGSLIGDGTFSDTTAYVAVWSEDGSGAVKDELANYLSGLPHSGSYRGFFDTSNQQRAGHKSFTDVAAGYGVVRGNKTITDKIERASLEFQSGVLRGYFDADGHVEGLSTGGGVSIRLSSVSMNNMVRVQRMLQRFGIKSAIRDLYPDGRESFGGYKSKRSYRLIITGSDTARFMDVIGFSNTAKHNKYHASIGKFYNKPHVTGVGSVEYVGFEDVYDVTVDKVHRFDANGVVVHNCSEINLRSGQYCNLTEVVIDPTDTLDAIRHKVKMATILGTYQATLTDFKYVRPVWKKNTEEERLLGVSLTGIYGHKFMSGQETRKDITLPEFLRELYDLTEQVNAEWSEKFGIPASTALTTVKPSGTVSQLVGASSGIHPWYAPYYIRTVRGDNKDPLTQFLKAQGVPNEPDVTKPDDTTVFSFPVKAPSGVITSRDLSAIDHLKLYCVYRENWTDHDVSVTINVREEEWPSVGAWVYDNFDRVGGVSFLPFSDHTYKQAPYQAISEDEYNVALSNMPTRIDWVDLPLYELEDSTAGNQTLACSGSSCEIVDITK